MYHSSNAPSFPEMLMFSVKRWYSHVTRGQYLFIFQTVMNTSVKNLRKISSFERLDAVNAVDACGSEGIAPFILNSRHWVMVRGLASGPGRFVHVESVCSVTDMRTALRA